MSTDLVDRLRSEAALTDNLWRTINNAKNGIDEMLRAKRIYEPYDAVVAAREDLAATGSAMREAADTIVLLGQEVDTLLEALKEAREWLDRGLDPGGRIEAHDVFARIDAAIAAARETSSSS